MVRGFGWSVWFGFKLKLTQNLTHLSSGILSMTWFQINQHCKLLQINKILSSDTDKFAFFFANTVCSGHIALLRSLQPKNPIAFAKGYFVKFWDIF